MLRRLPPLFMQQPGDETDAAPPTQSNGFYSLYSEDELADLWAVHTQFFGAREAADEPDEPAEGPVDARSILGGLHAAVLQTIADGEAVEEAVPPLESSEPEPQP